MTKKQICESNKTIAYYSGLGGLEIKALEYGVDDYIYCVSGAWGGKKSYHKLKVYTGRRGDGYIKLHGYKIPLNECMRV